MSYKTSIAGKVHHHNHITIDEGHIWKSGAYMNVYELDDVELYTGHYPGFIHYLNFQLKDEDYDQLNGKIVITGHPLHSPLRVCVYKVSYLPQTMGDEKKVVSLFKSGLYDLINNHGISICYYPGEEPDILKVLENHYAYGDTTTCPTALQPWECYQSYRIQPS